MGKTSLKIYIHILKILHYYKASHLKEIKLQYLNSPYGLLKDIPYFVGDVFKPAGWRGPAKHVRGSIFDTNIDWFSWTGPNYLK